MTTRTLRKPLPTNAANDSGAQTANAKEQKAHLEHEGSVRVARVDHAHKSDRGHRGGNLGKQK